MAELLLGLGKLLLGSQSLLQPILAVHKTGDNVGDHIVACGIDHGCGRIHQVADGHQDGECNIDNLGEEDDKAGSKYSY